MTRDATGAHTRQGPRQGSRQEPSPDRSPAAHRGRAATPPARARPPRSAQTKCCGGSAAALRRPVRTEGREKRSSSLLPLLCSAPRRFRLLGCGGARPEPRGAPPEPPGRGGGRKRRAVPAPRAPAVAARAGGQSGARPGRGTVSGAGAEIGAGLAVGIGQSGGYRGAGGGGAEEGLRRGQRWWSG